MKETGKFGFWSIVLLGINGIVGTGIFLLPNKAYSIIGSASLGVLLFDAVIAGCIALCFAEAASLFTRNGGPYLYAKHALGDFWAFEVGVLKWIVTVIAWAAMAVGFATALGAAVPALSGDFAKDVISFILIVGLTIVNIFGVNVSKFVNNLITISKLVPLALFIAIGIFFINGANFTPVFPQDTYVDGSFAQAAVLLFFAYTGFEVIAIAAEDMKNPKKNLPRAIIMCMLLVSVLYMAILAVSIGVLGSDLANTKAPVQDAFNVIVGPIGMYVVLVGTLISMGGINFAEAYYAPRVATSRNRYNAPYVAAIVTAIASVLLAWSGSFTTLAAISAVSRFTQYLPTCLAVIIFRRKWADKTRSYTIPGGYLIPVIAIGTSLWMLAQAQTNQLLWGLGGCIVILPFYYSYWKKKKAGLIKDHDEM
ncbi:MAG: APC family permease [Veillonella sp.]|nr:APC family permease [Veillonella sp.]